MNISGFDNLEQIGEGAIAFVWKGHQVSLQRDVAIKVLKQEFSSDPERITLLASSAKSAASLKHPSIVQIYDGAEEDGIYYFVMEYVAGQTVAQVLKKGPMPWKNVAKIGLAVAEALENAWTNARLIHSGITPGNIMFDDDGTVKLVDLGLVMRHDAASLAQQIESQKLEVNPNYISPEQAKCKITLDCRADMYSLGATMYHMVTGRIPFEESSPLEALNKHVAGNLPNPRDIVPSISPGMCQLITKLMLKNPEHRYATWQEAINDFKKVITGRPIIANQNKSTVGIAVKKDSEEIDRNQVTTASVPQPVWITAIAWSILLLCWTYIIMSICQLPPVSALPKPVSYEAAKPKVAARSAPSKEPDIIEDHDQQEPDAVTPTPPQKKEKPKPPLNGEKFSEEEKQLLTTLKSKVADYIVRDSCGEAIDIIAQEKIYSGSPAVSEELARMDECVKAIAKKDQLIEAALSKQIGRETSVYIRGANWPVIVRAVEAGVLKVDVKSKIGNEVKLRPATITLAQLSPGECIRLLGPADTEGGNAINFVLSLKGKDYQMALKLADKTGPFAKTFKELVVREMARQSNSNE